MYLGYRGKVNAKTETDYEKILKKEMTVYEVEGVKWKTHFADLQLLDGD